MVEVMTPTVRGMVQDGIPYTGFLYAGLMIDSEGTPRVLEYNCRFGDPETQPIMLRMKSDLGRPLPCSTRRTIGPGAGSLGSSSVTRCGYGRGWLSRELRNTGDIITGLSEQECSRT